MKKYTKLLYLVLIIYNCVTGQSVQYYNNMDGLIQNLADPYVLQHNGKFYMYGTSDTESDMGIPVYVSDDLVHWQRSAGAKNGYAVSREDVWGDRWFWSGDVILHKGKFYMYLTAEEHLVVAVSDSPLGPFIQEVRSPMHPDIKEIDGSVFVDDDGKAYIYFVRFDDGNVVFGAQLSDDMMSMKEETITECLRAEQPWEFSKNEPQAKINEGAFMLKHKGIYYLTYTANHFLNIDYSVGYAVSDNPLGPWKKYEGNPILRGNDKIMGTGNGVFLKLPDENNMWYVYHYHFGNGRPRRIAMDRARFIADSNGGPDILEIDGPTTTDQKGPVIENNNY